jgi:hypothetical protein
MRPTRHCEQSEAIHGSVAAHPPIWPRFIRRRGKTLKC